MGRSRPQLCVIAAAFCILCPEYAGSLAFTLGASYAWPSYTINLFQTEFTPLSRNVTTTDGALIGSIASIGAAVAVPIAGWLMNIVGRKMTLILTGIPYVITWLIILFTTKVELIILAMFLVGLGGSSLVIIPLYVGEIAQPSLRGTMTSSCTVLYMLGVLVSYLVSGWLVYKQIAYLMLGSSVMSLVLLLIFIRESPIYLLQIGEEMQAKKVFAFYRKYSINSKEMLEDINQTKKSLSLEEQSDKSNDAEKQPLKEQGEAKEKQNEFFNSFKLLWTIRSSRRAFIMLMIIVSCTISMGITCLIVYAAKIFGSLAPSYNLTNCSVILAIVQMCGGIVSTAITDLFGRKTLMMSSTYTCALCCVVIGLQVQFRFGPEWFIVTALYVFTFAFNLGAGTVPSVLIAEIFPPEVKGLCSALAFEWMAILNFVVLFAFTLIDNVVGMNGNFYVFGAISLFCGLYTTFCLPETKGLSFDEIQMLFAETNKKGKNAKMNQQIQMESDIVSTAQRELGKGTLSSNVSAAAASPGLSDNAIKAADSGPETIKPTTPKTGPYFDLAASKNVTALLGKTAYLTCRVKNLGNKTMLMQVSWVRHRDIHLLTVGHYTYTSDQRFRAIHQPHTEDWTLQIKYPQHRDSGIYECQISTTPHMSHFIHLNVVEPTTDILGGPELYIDRGSTINLTCVVLYSPEPPAYIFWNHNDAIISYDSPRGGVSVVTEKGETTTSFLLIQQARPTDSGTYQCNPSNAQSKSIVVHVLNGEYPAAMQRGSQLFSPISLTHSIILAVSLLLVFS